MRTSRQISTTTKAVAAGAIGLGVLGIGIGVANAEPTPSPSSSATTSSTSPPDDGSETTARERGGHRHGKGGMRGVDTAALASKLGVSEADLTTALENVREAMRDSEPRDSGSRERGTGPSEAERTARQDAFATALASKLGIDKAKVTDAFTELRTERQTEVRDVFSARLDEAVSAGTITAGDKASILKAFDAGLLGGGPGGRH